MNGLSSQKVVPFSYQQTSGYAAITIGREKVQRTYILPLIPIPYHNKKKEQLTSKMYLEVKYTD